MTKKDYIIIAKILARLRDYSAHCFDSEEDFDLIIDEFQKELIKDNPRFNPGYFKSFINQELNRLFEASNK